MLLRSDRYGPHKIALRSLQIGIILIWKRHLGSIVHLLLVLGEQLSVNSCGRWGKGGGGNKFKSGVSDQLAGQPEEGLLEVVVGLGGDIVVLEVLLSVEGDCLCLDLSLLDINLVAGEDDGDVLADTDQVTVPVGNVLVGNSGGNVEHDDTTLAVDIVSITQTTELLLSCSIPDIELNVAQVLTKILAAPNKLLVG